MSKLLINENPLLVLPSLAKVIGLNEALFAQQLHYWLNSSASTSKDGRQWVCNTLDRWHENFPFWSKRTIQRVIDSLKSHGIVETASFNQEVTDRTLWYTIDYKRVDAIESGEYVPQMVEDPCGQVVHMDVDKLSIPCGQNGHMGESDSHVDKLATSNSIILETNKKRLIREVEVSGSAGASPVSSRIEVTTKKDTSSVATVEDTKSAKAERLLAEQDRIKQAMASFEAYAEYMKLKDIYAKPVLQWTSTDFVKFFFCGMAKYSPTGPVSMPIWAKDARIMQTYMKKYGCENLRELIVVLCQRKEEVEKRCNRQLTLSMSILAIPWIMSEVEAIAFRKEEAAPLTARDRIMAQREAEERAAEVRRKLQAGVKT